jgi:hypothetical protein
MDRIFVIWFVGAWKYLIYWQHLQSELSDEKLKRQLDPMTKEEWEELVLALQEEKEQLDQSASQHDADIMQQQRAD